MTYKKILGIFLMLLPFVAVILVGIAKLGFLVFMAVIGISTSLAGCLYTGAALAGMITLEQK